MWPEFSPPSSHPRRLHLLEHVAVADLRARERDVLRAPSACSNPRLLISVPTTPPLATLAALVVGRDHVQQLVAVVERPSRSTMTRRSPSPSSAMPMSAWCSRTCCARYSGCVAPVPALMLRPSGSTPDGDHFGAEFVEHVGRDLVAGAVRAVDDDAPATQIEFARKRALAELDVAARRVVDAPRLARARRTTRTRAAPPSAPRSRARRRRPAWRRPPRRT